MIILGTNSIKDTGYDVANSCRFNSADNAYMGKTSSSNGTATSGTFSCWIKRGNLGATSSIMSQVEDGSNFLILRFTSGNALDLRWRDSGSGTDANLTTNRLFRDPSAWINIVVKFLTSDGTGSNRVKIYINGVQETSFSSSDYPTQNDALYGNVSSGVYRIGDNGFGATGEDFDGYITEVVWLDGTSTTPTSFGEFDEDSGIWKPIDVSGLTFGTNGFYLDFEDSANLGNDANGGTDLTEVNLAATDQSTDTCTNNFAIWNSLQPTNAAMSEGNLVGASSASSGHYSGISSIGVSSGKWYFECKQIQESASNEGMIGIIIFYNTVTALLNPVGRGGAWGMQDGNRGFSTDSGGSGSTTDSFHAGWSNNDTIGIALDIDNSRVYYSKGGQWNNSGSWNAASPTTSQTLQNALGDGTYFFMAGDASGSNNCTWSANFGSPAHAISSGNTDGNGYGNFEYAVPSGYFSLNTKNLSEYG